MPTVYKYVVKAHFDPRGVTLLVDVTLDFDDDGLAVSRARRLVREEFGDVVMRAVSRWTVEAAGKPPPTPMPSHGKPLTEEELRDLKEF